MFPWKSFFCSFALACYALLPLLPATASASPYRQNVPVLAYHSISTNPKDIYCLPPKKFEQQMYELFKRGYHPLTAAELVDDWRHGKHLPPKPVVITFDDGYEDNYTAAFPVLQKFRMKATIFLATALVGHPHYLTWPQIKRMHQSGLIDFESHSVHHPDLTLLSAYKAAREFSDSKRTLETQLHKQVTLFAYPFGKFTPALFPLLQKAGYKAAFDSEQGLTSYSQGLYSLHRLAVYSYQSLRNVLHSMDDKSWFLTW